MVAKRTQKTTTTCALFCRRRRTRTRTRTRTRGRRRGRTPISARWTRFLPAPSPRPSFPRNQRHEAEVEHVRDVRDPTCPSTIPKGLECSKRYPWTFLTNKSNAYSSSWRRFIRRNRGSGCRYTASDRY